MHIREFKTGDETALRDVFFSAVHDIAAADYSAEQCAVWAPVEYAQAKWAQRMEQISPFIAEREGRIAGYASVAKNGYIDHFFVRASDARHGVGTLLMRHIHARAATWQSTYLFANVSVTARPFFEKWEFTVEIEQSNLVQGIAINNFRMGKHV